MNKGWYKKYEYQGINQPATKATKKHGSSKAPFVLSTEASTASLDPKYSSNVSTSQAQYTSSWGPCSALALNTLKTERDLYFAQNRDEVLREIARGQGEHLEVLAAFSLCDQSATNLFAQQTQQNMVPFLSATSIAPVINHIIEAHPQLAQSCAKL